MIYINILDNILSGIPPFPLLPLESLIKVIYIFIGGSIEFDVEYILNFCVNFVPYSNLPDYHLEYNTAICPLKISNIDEFNNFVTLEYENTLSHINHHWNHIQSIDNFHPRIPGEPVYWYPNRFHVHSLSVSLIKY